MIKRTVRGVGYNTRGKHKSNVNGKPTKVYMIWQGMFNRCYNDYQLDRRPNYEGCTVAESWYNFQDFGDWYDNQPHNGDDFQLDKDILFKGNKVYSPETCCLVPRQINMLLVSAARARGEFPQGVHYYKPLDKYKAIVRINGKHKYLGYHDTPEQAYEVYKREKEAHVKHMADLWFGNIEPRVYEALMDWTLED